MNFSRCGTGRTALHSAPNTNRRPPHYIFHPQPWHVAGLSPSAIELECQTISRAILHSIPSPTNPQSLRAQIEFLVREELKTRLRFYTRGSRLGRHPITRFGTERDFILSMATQGQIDNLVRDAIQPQRNAGVHHRHCTECNPVYNRGHRHSTYGHGRGHNHTSRGHPSAHNHSHHRTAPRGVDVDDWLDNLSMDRLDINDYYDDDTISMAGNHNRYSPGYRSWDGHGRYRDGW